MSESPRPGDSAADTPARDSADAVAPRDPSVRGRGKHQSTTPSTSATPLATVKAMAARAGRVPAPARNASLLVVLGLAVVGGGIYVAVSDASSGPAAAAASAGPGTTSAATQGAGTANTGGNVPIPGPMPGAPTSHPAGQGTSASSSRSTSPSQVTPNQGGPTPLQPSSDSPIKSWKKGPGGTALTLVTLQSGNVLMSHASGLYPAMLNYCTALSSAVLQAKAAAPIPDAPMQQMYSTALEAFKTGSADCVAGISRHMSGAESTVTNVNRALIDKAVSSLDQGVRDLYIATGALRPQ